MSTDGSGHPAPPLPRRCAVVPVGAPGAGKSRFLTAMAVELGDPGFRHGPDDVRLLAFGTTAYQGAGHLVHEAARAVFAARLASGRSAAYDATNTTRRERRPLVEVAHRYGTPAVALVFRLPLATLLAHNQRRPRPDQVVPEDVVVRYAARVDRLTPDGLAEEGFDHVLDLGKAVEPGVWWRPAPGSAPRVPDPTEELLMVSADAVHAVLDDIDYPASKDELVRHAEARGADDEVIGALRALPLGPYDSREDVTKGLAPPR